MFANKSRAGDALLGGAAGAVAVTVVHEVARRVVPDAPRMDTLGRRALARLLRAVGLPVPSGDVLQAEALAGDLVANSAYYSLVGLGDPAGAWARGLALGAAAGVGAVVLPGPLGLGAEPGNRTRRTQALTVAWYVLGGLAAAAVVQAHARRG